MNTTKLPLPRVILLKERTSIQLILAAVLMVCGRGPTGLQAQVGETVRWTGGNTYQSWLDSANWDKQVVPLNNVGTNFTVIVPDGSSLTCDGGGAGTIEALSLGNGSILQARNGNSLLITGATIIRGNLDAQGNGSALRAPGNLSVLQNYPSLYASDGGIVSVAVSTYTWDNNSASSSLLAATGAGSLVEMTNVSSFQVGYYPWAPQVYSVAAAGGGVIDLRNLSQITGPGNDDWLDINISTGGDVRLDKLSSISGRVRFIIDKASYSLPNLGRGTDVSFSLSDSSALVLPNLLSINSGAINLAPLSSFTSPSLLRLQSVDLNVGSGATAKAPALREFVGGTIRVNSNADVNLPGLITLESVPIELNSNGGFTAPVLQTYRNSDINISPSRNLQLGLLTDIYASRIGVSGGSSFRVNATSYSTPWDWEWSPTLFSADGSGSLLDLSSLKSLLIFGGYYNSFSYSITANNGGIVDLSGLEIATGPRSTDHSHFGDDWLTFNIRTGGRLLLPNLKKLLGGNRFNIEVSQFELSSLQTAERTQFNLADGSILRLPEVTELSEGTSFTWGFNSRVEVPKLAAFVNSDLALAPGRQFVGSPPTNINSSRLSVSGGSIFRAAADTYTTPWDWEWSPTLFSADGTGSLLDLSSLKSILVYGGYYNSFTYSVTANNGGVVDLSGLEVATGPRPNDHSHFGDDWLTFNLRNGGKILLPTLRQFLGGNRLNIDVDQFELPMLQSAERTQFNLADGAVLRMPALTQLSDGVSFSWGFNTRVEMPRLTTFVNSDLVIATGHQIICPAPTNIDASRISVDGGNHFQVLAKSYAGLWDWEWSPTLFSVNGSGSLLDLSALRSLLVYGGYYNAFTYSIAANNAGVLDLNGLEKITGPRGSDHGHFADDWLAITANNGALVKLGNAEADGNVRFQANGGASKFLFESIHLKPTTTLSLTGKADVEVYGDFIFDNTDPNSIVVENAYFQMDGATSQRLEVGGRDAGPGGFSSRNFGYSQLIVGSSNQTSVVRLVDNLNNGNRGAGGEAEALYLYGMDGAGLRVLNGSKLILGGVNCYAQVSGLMTRLNSLIPAGSNSVAFDGGFIATTAGPRVIDSTPAGRLLPAVDHLDVTFDIPINGPSFTATDIHLTGPGGLIAIHSITPVGGNTWRIQFAPQTADGTYHLDVGPDIADAAGHLTQLDQDGDGNAGESEDDVFQTSFTLDSTPPAIVGAYALQNGTWVGVTFSEPVAEEWATNTANYNVPSTTPSQAVLQANRYQVALRVNALAGDSFTVTATGLTDTLRNQTNHSFIGTILPMQASDIGSPGSDPVVDGSTVPFGPGYFDVVAGGSTIWGTQDAGQFAYETRTGDFDVGVRIAGQTTPSQYTQAGLMARPSLAGQSSCVYGYVQSHPNVNSYWLSSRWADAGSMVASSSWNTNNSGVELPNAWLRLKRQGDVFTALRSTNGLDWLALGQLTKNLPAQLLVGPASSADLNSPGQSTMVWYRDYQDFGPSIQSQPLSQTVTSGVAVAFGVVARGRPLLSYQWFFNGLPLSNETNSLLTLPVVTVANVGDYRVTVANSYGAITSQVATLVVDGVGIGGFEGDVMPHPNGNNAVTISDWVEVGLLVVGLDTVLNSSEFTRADCAPRWIGTDLALGDGRLTVADWTQAGRYAAGLDANTPAGGPNAPVAGGPGLLRGPKDGGERSLVITRGAAWQGCEMEVPVQLVSAGNENALGFSLIFDPTRLSYHGLSLGAGAPGAYLQVNDQSAASGKLGVALANAVGQHFNAGTQEVARVRFVAHGEMGDVALSFADQPVFREIVDASAEPLKAVYVSGAAQVIQAPRFAEVNSLAGGGIQLTVSGPAGEACALQASSDLLSWTTISTHVLGNAPLLVLDSEAPTHTHRFYRLVPQR